ncbi:MAG: zinc ribbon domain-containing protein [Candidatus Hodarchaeota archaeon]
MLSCPNCKSGISDADIFCSNCGYNLLTAAKVIKANKIIEKSIDLNMSIIEKFNRLNNQIDGLSDIPSELKQQKDYIETLKHSLNTAQSRLGELSSIRKEEEEDVEKLEKLSITSFLARIKGSKEEQLEKEKIEFITALNKEEAAKNEYEKLSKVISETQSQINELEKLNRIRIDLELEIKGLINEICEGVADPIEDTIEHRLQSLEAGLLPIENERTRILRAKNHLEHAVKDLEYAEQELGGASGMATWDTFFGGGLIVDSIKHSKMSTARDSVHNAYNSIEWARKEYPQIPTMRGGQVEELSFFWDGFMDNIFSDLSARDKIHRSRESVIYALDHTHSSINFLNSELNKLNSEYNNLNAQIEETKTELFKERKRMIQEAIKKVK